MIEKCKFILNDIICFGKLKDLLCQYTLGQEIEDHEKLNLLPIHMFISKDLVDFVYMTSAMLLEAQNTANP